MRILVVGGGGREHALVWKLAASPRVTKIYCAPGNPGIGQISECVAIDVTDNAALLRFALDKKVDLTVVGPEAPLANGIVDLFTANGLKIFGPTQAAAQIEGSKAFAKKHAAVKHSKSPIIFVRAISSFPAAWPLVNGRPKWHNRAGR